MDMEGKRERRSERERITIAKEKKNPTRSGKGRLMQVELLIHMMVDFCLLGLCGCRMCDVDHYAGLGLWLKRVRCWLKVEI
jgi:hypothetical protein